MLTDNVFTPLDWPPARAPYTKLWIMFGEPQALSYKATQKFKLYLYPPFKDFSKTLSTHTKLSVPFKRISVQLL